MTTQQIVEYLRHYNEWRRGNDAPQPDPTEVGKAIDAACEAMEHPIRVSSVCRELTRERDEAREQLAAERALANALGNSIYRYFPYAYNNYYGMNKAMKAWKEARSE